MAQDYYTILTNAGLAYEAQQKAQNKPITLTTMAIGDGNGAVYNPDPTATALRREVHRQPINALLQDPNNPNWLVCEGWLADDVGGWTIREVGIYTDTGVLYAICKYPESIKPMLASGSGKQFYVRTIFQTSNAASVTLLVDNSVVMAPRAYVIDYVRDELAKLDSKQSVRAATTGPIVLTGLEPVDDVALTAGDRVLVKNQVAGAENGIYVVGAGAWARAADANSAAKLTSGAVIPVESGTLNADTLWMLKTDGAVVVGTTSLAFQWVGGLNAPDQAAGDSSRKIANTAFVQAAMQAHTDASDPHPQYALSQELQDGFYTRDQAKALFAPGLAIFDASGDFIPVREDNWVTAIAGGGGGGAGGQDLNGLAIPGGGGGAGQSVFRKLVKLVPGVPVRVTIGKGGKGAPSSLVKVSQPLSPGAAGGITSLGTYLSLSGGGGGGGGFTGSGNTGGNGGSGWPGGGSGEYSASTITQLARGGHGGCGLFGGGGPSVHGYQPTKAVGPGAGGGGGALYYCDGADSGGGDGADGILIVEW